MSLTSGAKLVPVNFNLRWAQGMEEFYRARDARLGRDLVVKAIEQKLHGN